MSKQRSGVYAAVQTRTAAAPSNGSGNGRASWPGVWGKLGVRRRATTATRRRRPATQNDVWRALADRVDPAKLRPKLADDIEIKRFTARNGDYVMMANPRDLIHYKFDSGDAELISLMDGTRTIEEIVVERLEESGEIELSGVADVVLTLYQGNFLDHDYIDADAAVERALKPGTRVSRKFRHFAKTLTVEFGSPQRLVEALYKGGVRVFFNPWVNVVTVATSIVGLIAFFMVVHKKEFTIGGTSLAAEGLILLALNYFLTFAHEVGHAIVLVRHGRRVKSAGFQIYFGSPAWFVDSTDSLMMEPKYRIASSFAGPYADMFLAGIGAIIILVWPHIPVGHVLFKFVALNYFLIFLNLIPLLELDGYYILADALRMPDLRPRSLSFLRYDFFRKVKKREPFHSNELGLLAYGVLGVAASGALLITGALYWKELFGGFVIGLWNGGLVTRLILILLGLFVGGPLIRGVISFGKFVVRRLRAVWRKIRFRYEQSWRIEAAELIDALPIFGDVPEDTLSDLAGRVKLLSISPGQIVVRQGERAEAFYVVRSGQLEVYETDPVSQKETILRVLGRGESFGELAVAMASVRTASVRAFDQSEIFQIDRNTFHLLLADMIEVPSFAPTLQQIAELGALPSFSHLEPDELAQLIDYGEWVQFAANETIIKQGETADAFYAIGSGQVDVVIGRKHVQTLGPGSHFGEVALLRRSKRTATCRARTVVRAYRLTRPGFDRLMKDAFKKGTLNPAAPADHTRQH
ncbi:MAG TPA: cyclic nucleotide-binding domain-containing protein [Actinomycetota bacterium]|nr:cyclic nucleotide-binding domain-containing protein [Actinomycetota bacterium]